MSVFISHAHDDEDIASEVSRFLTITNGIAATDIVCSSQLGRGEFRGAELISKVVEHIGRSRNVVTILTPNSLFSGWVWTESGIGVASNRFPIFLVSGLSDVELPSYVIARKYYKLTKEGEVIDALSSCGPALDPRVAYEAARQVAAAGRRARYSRNSNFLSLLGPSNYPADLEFLAIQILRHIEAVKVINPDVETSTTRDTGSVRAFLGFLFDEKPKTIHRNEGGDFLLSARDDDVTFRVELGRPPRVTLVMRDELTE